MFVSNFDHKKWGADNVLATLEHNDRIVQLRLFLSLGQALTGSSSKLLAATQRPFPALRDLAVLYADFLETIIIPTSFLGGSAPNLERLILRNISFPNLPKLLLSATRLNLSSS
jgi:hypothetical protein